MPLLVNMVKSKYAKWEQVRENPEYPFCVELDVI